MSAAVNLIVRIWHWITRKGETAQAAPVKVRTYRLAWPGGQDITVTKLPERAWFCAAGDHWSLETLGKHGDDGQMMICIDCWIKQGGKAKGA